MAGARGEASGWTPGAGAGRPVLVGAQYLRAAAALGVVAAHSAGNAAFAKYLGQAVFGGLLDAGAVGVELFFVLSGFIMAYINLGADLAPRRGALTFFKERFARIVPMLWLVALVYAALTAVGFGGYTLIDCLRAAVLWPGKTAPNVVWTLRQELVFYTLFGVSYLWRLPRWLLWVWFIAPLPLAFAPAIPVIWAHVALAVIFAPSNLLFGLGFVLGLAWLKGFAVGPRKAGVALLGAALAVVFVTAAVIHDVRSIPATLIVGPLSLAAVWAATQVVASRSWLGAALRFLGDASYSTYLFHGLAISALLTVLARVRILPAPLAVALVFAVAATFGALVHWLVERGLVAWVRRALGVGPAAALRFRRA